MALQSLDVIIFRWCVRVKSLKTLLMNYQALQEFFSCIIDAGDSDASAIAKARGFSDRLEGFQFHFLLIAMINIFERVEVLNTQLQKINMHITESYEKIMAVNESLKQLRSQGFKDTWEQAVGGAKELGLNDPKTPRVRKIPKRLDSGSPAHQFSTEEEYHRKMYFEILDQVTTSLTHRFSTKDMKFLCHVENFIIGASENGSKVPALDVASFYTRTFEKDGVIEQERDFDEEQLKLHTKMFHDILKERNVKVACLMDVVVFLAKNSSVASLLPHFTKLIRLVLTVPHTTCTAERSFSTLRRLKTYLRSTMTQSRLNALSILHIHSDVGKVLNLDPIIDEFVLKNRVRINAFALSTQMRK